ncbi:XRE family transcriptional regulator [Streptomyces sp. NPDC057197]|uniref:XRE family transcriptional regulator n=1 Tax=Streptomyces sp. NPDC057197 TaxID=3346045 RepID=UPI0036442A76
MHPPPPDDLFAPALHRALAAKGLALTRVRALLAERGVRISASSLSHWQRGRSRPEHPRSRRAVRELEDILDLAPGALAGHLGVPARRGAALLPPTDPTAMRQVHGIGSRVEHLLGASFERLNENLRPVTIRDVAHLDARGRLRKLAVSRLCRSLRDGTDRITVAHGLTDSALSGDDSLTVDVVMHTGTLGAARLDSALGAVAMEVRFGRGLARGETALVEYDVLVGGTSARPSTCLERKTCTRLRDLLIQVRFHPDAVPSHCVQYYRRTAGGERLRPARAPVDVSGTAHASFADFPPGVHGLSWRWPSEARVHAIH